MKDRNLFMDDTDYYWTPELGYRDRLIIPFYYEKRIVGWTARTVQPDKQPKYMSEQQPGFVYGLDEQGPNKVFTIVCEGPIDALHVDGVALLGSEIKDQQAMLINRVGKQVIVIPDKDEAGSKLIDEAIELGWSVSLPDWADDVKIQMNEDSVIVVDGSMIEEVEFGGIKYHLVLENYILGFLQ